MAKQSDLAAQLTETGNVLAKVNAETRSLLTKIDELAAAIEAAGEVTPELQAAADALKAQAEAVDALVPDAAPAPEPEA